MAGGIGHDRHTCFGQHIRRAGDLVRIDLAERISVADRDPAAQPRRRRAPGNAPQLIHALLPWLVQVNVDLGAMPPGDPEHDIEMRIRIAVERGWVQSADDARALPDGCFEQIRGPGRADDAGLGKGDDL